MNATPDTELRGFARDIFVFGLAQGILLVFGFVQSLLIPKFLTVESYGYWQVFLLYGSYIGILHVGFLDGVLLRWAGKDISEITGEIAVAFRFLVIELLTIILPLGAVSYFVLRPHIGWIGLWILAWGLVMCLETFFVFVCQAAKRFKFLAILNLSVGGLFLVLILILKAINSTGYSQVVIAYIATYILALFALMVFFRKYLRSASGRRRSSVAEFGKANISVGIFVLLGNFGTAVMFSIDRMMINALFPLQQFAIYAFALTISGIGNALVGAVSQVFLPYIKGAVPELRNKAYHLAKSAVIILWAGALTLYFPLSKIIRSYLSDYAPSVPIIQIIFGTIGFCSIIQILHANYYKAYGKQRQYFSRAIVILAISAISVFIVIKAWHTLESVAITMFVIFGSWYALNEVTLEATVGELGWRSIRKDLITMAGYLAVFWLTSLATSWFVAQTMVYLSLFCLITWLLLRHEVRELFTIGNRTLPGRLAKRRVE